MITILLLLLLYSIILDVYDKVILFNEQFKIKIKMYFKKCLFVRLNLFFNGIRNMFIPCKLSGNIH